MRTVENSKRLTACIIQTKKDIEKIPTATDLGFNWYKNVLFIFINKSALLKNPKN
jgi:hypothetical protein